MRFFLFAWYYRQLRAPVYLAARASGGTQRGKKLEVGRAPWRPGAYHGTTGTIVNGALLVYQAYT